MSHKSCSGKNNLSTFFGVLLSSNSSSTEKLMRLIFTFFLLFSLISLTWGQKILQIETYGKAKTEKLFIGQGITYQLKDSEDWHYVVIEDLLIDQQLIQTVRGYLKITDIGALRTERGWSGPAKVSLMTFGAAWSVFGVIGYATDGRPETKYSAGDAIVTVSSVATGWLIGKIFKYKKTKFGKRKNLRMIEIPIQGGFPGNN